MRRLEGVPGLALGLVVLLLAIAVGVYVTSGSSGGVAAEDAEQERADDRQKAAEEAREAELERREEARETRQEIREERAESAGGR